MSGWVRLDRKVFESDIGEDNNLLIMWIRLLALAEWRPKKTKLGPKQVKLEPGQMKVSYRELSAECRFGVKTVMRCLHYLATTHRIATSPTHDGTIITICKYDIYQKVNKRLETQLDTSGEHDGVHEGNVRGTSGEHDPQKSPAISKELQPSNNKQSNKVTREQGTNPNTSPLPVADGAPIEPEIILGPKKEKAPKEQKGGSYAFDRYAIHYESKYGVKPLRDRMANIHAKSISESVPREDLDTFFACYLNNPNQFYVQKAHPLSIARIDVQKIHTEMLTGMRLSSHKARQFEMHSESEEAAKRYLAKVGNEK